MRGRGPGSGAPGVPFLQRGADSGGTRHGAACGAAVRGPCRCGKRPARRGGAPCGGRLAGRSAGRAAGAAARMAAFLQSPLAARMREAKKLLREYDFITAVPAKFVDDTLPRTVRAPACAGAGHCGRGAGEWGYGGDRGLLKRTVAKRRSSFAGVCKAASAVPGSCGKTFGRARGAVHHLFLQPGGGKYRSRWRRLAANDFCAPL